MLIKILNGIQLIKQDPKKYGEIVDELARLSASYEHSVWCSQHGVRNESESGDTEYEEVHEHAKFLIESVFPDADRFDYFDMLGGYGDVPTDLIEFTRAVLEQKKKEVLE